MFPQCSNYKKFDVTVLSFNFLQMFQKAIVFFPTLLIQPSLMIAIKAGAQLLGIQLLWLAPVITDKLYTRTEKPATNKHSNLLCPFVKYEENKVL